MGGQTGSLFASEQADIVPDIACYSKGITGGIYPLVVTMCASRIYDSHYSLERSKTFFHTSSYTANPIACAVAAANLDMWQENAELGKVRSTAEMEQNEPAQMGSLSSLTNLRHRLALSPPWTYMSQTATTCRKLAHNYTLSSAERHSAPLTRQYDLCDVTYCISEKDFDKVYGVIAEMVKKF